MLRAQTPSPRCSVVVRIGSASSGVVLVTWAWFKITRSVAQSPLVAEQCDVIIHSFTLHRTIAIFSPHEKPGYGPPSTWCQSSFGPPKILGLPPRCGSCKSVCYITGNGNHLTFDVAMITSRHGHKLVTSAVESWVRA
ncbi:hypothetical protein TNCV_4485271 [Trichonephila clavipes]|nr:hypothetical protein TNCV_4485271 [Trichonephila clavipes]